MNVLKERLEKDVECDALVVPHDIGNTVSNTRRKENCTSLRNTKDFHHIASRGVNGEAAAVFIRSPLYLNNSRPILQASVYVLHRPVRERIVLVDVDKCTSRSSPRVFPLPSNSSGSHRPAHFRPHFLALRDGVSDAMQRIENWCRSLNAGGIIRRSLGQTKFAKGTAKVCILDCATVGFGVEGGGLRRLGPNQTQRRCGPTWTWPT
jgi:hypothetical protein